MIHAYQPRPRQTSAEERFHKRVRSIYAGRVRFVWKPDACPESEYGPGRWIMQEKGHETGRWGYSWTVSGPNGEPRRLGDWIFAKILEMDRYALGLNGRAAWNRLSKQMDSGRLMRARRVAGHFDQARETVRDKAAHHFGDRIIVPSNPEAVLSGRSMNRHNRRANRSRARRRS